MMPNFSDSREYDLVVWGATGFTGHLVAEHLLACHGTSDKLRWAIAGRNQSKLERVRQELGPAAQTIPILVGDSHDPASLDPIVARSAVVCSTVGPFAKYGTELVAACARHGTHYCDITGEVQWVRHMIDRYEEPARTSGARIVHCCGFDSIPADLGCLFINQQMQEIYGCPCDEVKYRVRRIRGTLSGGTAASVLNVFEESREDREIRRILADPYSLKPLSSRTGPKQPDQLGPVWDADVNSWTAPYVMAVVDSKIVHRSNALLDHRYGRQFRYSEAVMTGRGPGGWTRAMSVTAGLTGFIAAASLSPTRALLNRFVLPQPGKGPSREQRERGFFDIVVLGKLADGRAQLRARVKGDRDPGYGATSRMLAESAVCLALNADELPVGGGSWTPASCMGARLMARLEENAGLSFRLET